MMAGHQAAKHHQQQRAINGATVEQSQPCTQAHYQAVKHAETETVLKQHRMALWIAEN
jgi:hypothetical protein